MRKLLLVVWSALLLLATECRAALPRADPVTADTILTLLPSGNGILPWTPKSPPRLFVGEKLYDLIDGGASPYLEFGFRQAVSQRYADATGGEISVEIYEMESPPAAYGMCTFITPDSGKDIGYGSGGSGEEGFIIFWKDRFLIACTGISPGDGTRNGVRLLARAVERAIGRTGAKPNLASLFLAHPAVLNPIRYVCGPLGINNRYAFADSNVFGVSEGIVGYSGKSTAFVFPYENRAEQARWYTWAMHTLRASPKNDRFTTTDSISLFMDRRGNHIGVQSTGKYTIVVVDPEGKELNELLRRITALLLQAE